MPYAAPRPCTKPGCPALVRGGGRCPEHQQQAQRTDQQRRGTAAQRGYDGRWRKARESYLLEHPLCAPCQLEGRVTPATVVDHIKAHKGDYTLFWDRDNWQPSCKPHHDARVDEGDFGQAVR